MYYTTLSERRHGLKPVPLFPIKLIKLIKLIAFFGNREKPCIYWGFQQFFRGVSLLFF